MKRNKIELNDTLFPVKEMPATYAFNEEAGISNVKLDTGYKFIVREDTNEVISCMTDKYQLLTNKKLYNISHDILKDTGGKLSEATTFGNGARTQWKWRFPDVEVAIKKGDVVNPEVIIKNSYDGSLEATAIAGAFRMICSNGMMIGHVIGKHGIRHNIWNNISNFKDIVQAMVNKTEQVFKDDFPQLLDTKLKKKHILDIVEMFPMQTMDDVVQYLLKDNPKTYWDLLNAATWITSHQMDRKKEATHKIEARIYPKIRRMIAQA